MIDGNKIRLFILVETVISVLTVKDISSSSTIVVVQRVAAFREEVVLQTRSQVLDLLRVSRRHNIKSVATRV